MERGQTKLFFTLFSVEQWQALLEVIFSYDFISSSCQDTKVTAIENVLLPSTNLFIDISSVSEQVPTGLFFSGCHQFYLEPSSLSGYFKTELLSLSHKALITRRAKRGARRTMPESSLFCRNGAGLANAHEGVSTFRNCQSDILFKKLFIWLCPVLAALQHVRSQFADQGLIPCSLHCKVDSQPLICQGSP